MDRQRHAVDRFGFRLFPSPRCPKPSSKGNSGGCSECTIRIVKCARDSIFAQGSRRCLPSTTLHGREEPMYLSCSPLRKAESSMHDIVIPNSGNAQTAATPDSGIVVVRQNFRNEK